MILCIESLDYNMTQNEFVPTAVRGELIWYAVDFDSTISKGTWSIETPNAVPGPPMNIDKLQELVDAGKKIIIHTSRPWGDYELIESWLNHYEVPFDKIVCGKLLAHRYVDDRAVNADEPSWL